MTMNEQPSIQDIRRYIDGELDDALVRQIEESLEHDVKLRKMIEFERRLKNQVLTVISKETPAAPPDLADRIRESLAQADEATQTQESDSAPRINLPGIFTGPQRANVFAVAAVLSIVAGAILFGIFGRPIDDQATPHSFVDLLHESAQFISNEHLRCAMDSGNLQQKLIYSDQSTANRELASLLGVDSIPRFDLSELGYAFRGGGECGVPAGNVSGHIMFERLGATFEFPNMVSIFMVRDRGQLDQNSFIRTPLGDWIDCNGGSQCTKQVLSATNGNILFFVCCCNEGELESVLELLTRQMLGP
ncbi:MAG: hypothetical protein O7G85_10055 [Planctomycetota bacterium]|nr:hypothetical protein [Planctomycetota bacterium]